VEDARAIILGDTPGKSTNKVVSFCYPWQINKQGSKLLLIVRAVWLEEILKEVGRVFTQMRRVKKLIILKFKV